MHGLAHSLSSGILLTRCIPSQLVAVSSFGIQAFNLLLPLSQGTGGRGGALNCTTMTPLEREFVDKHGADALSVGYSIIQKKRSGLRLQKGKLELIPVNGKVSVIAFGEFISHIPMEQFSPLDSRVIRTRTSNPDFFDAFWACESPLPNGKPTVHYNGVPLS